MTDLSKTAWSLESIPDDPNGFLLMDNFDELEETSSRRGVALSKHPLREDAIRLISEEEDWLNFSEDFRDLSLEDIERLARQRVPQPVYLSERVFSQPVLDVLLALNATNLQIFPVRLVHPYTQRVWSDYGVVNVVGLFDLKRNPDFVVAFDEKRLEVVFSHAAKSALESTFGFKFMKRHPRLP
jgi:hypothetical protein